MLLTGFKWWSGGDERRKVKKKRDEENFVILCRQCVNFTILIEKFLSRFLALNPIFFAPVSERTSWESTLNGDGKKDRKRNKRKSFLDEKHIKNLCL